MHLDPSIIVIVLVCIKNYSFRKGCFILEKLTEESNFDK